MFWIQIFIDLGFLIGGGILGFALGLIYERDHEIKELNERPKRDPKTGRYAKRGVK
jgi:hypothetical protein